MKQLAGLLDRVFLVFAVLAAGILPSFVAQYRQRIAGRLDQLNLDLDPWRQIAGRLHGGDLQALVQHHINSGDATFVAEASAITAMQQQLGELQAAVGAMQGDILQRIYGWLQHVNGQDARATWTLFEPQFPLDPQSLMFAIAGGAAAWLAFIVLIWSVAAIAGRLFGQPTSKHKLAR